MHLFSNSKLKIQMLRETRVRVKSKPFPVAALNELRFCGRDLFNDCLCRRSWVIGSNDGPAHHNVIRTRFDGFSRCRRAGLIILFSAGGFLRRANARRDDQKFAATCFPDGFGFLYGGHDAIHATFFCELPELHRASQGRSADAYRSEEHTSELQSHSFISYAVFCLKKMGMNWPVLTWAAYSKTSFRHNKFQIV